jgi:hypothetical protein
MCFRRPPPRGSSRAQRENFGTRAVQEKGDQTPDQWRPPLEGYWCTYARMWIRDKTNWGLTVTSAEQAALTDMLNRC